MDVGDRLDVQQGNRTMIAVASVTFVTITFWWVMRQTVWNLQAAVLWRVGLICLESAVAVAFVIGQYEPDPLMLRVAWSILNLLVFGVFAYWFDHRPTKQ
jgi:hypothetical protein